jgi:hypothetical protein
VSMGGPDGLDVLDLLGDELGETLLKALGLGGGSVTPGGDRGLRDVQASIYHPEKDQGRDHS